MCCCYRARSAHYRINVWGCVFAYKSARIAELLGETKINQVHSVAMSANTHQEIIWLYIAVHEVAVVHELQTSDLSNRPYLELQAN